MSTFSHLHHHVKTCKETTYWTILVILPLVLLPSLGFNSFCDNVQVYNGSSSTVTCHFENDISVHKKNIYIDHRHWNHDSAESVISCRWQNATFLCDNRTGYQLGRNVTKYSISVHIPETLPEHAGQYWCEVLSTDASNNSRCQLDVLLSEDTITNSYKDSASTISTSSTKNHKVLKGIKSFCTVIRIGSSAFITCCFDSDIRMFQKHVFLDHASINGSEAVLSCRWKDGNPHCEPSSGYKMNSTVSDRLTVEIPSVDDEHAGEYWCEVLQSEPAKYKRCMLNVSEESKNDTTQISIQEKNGTHTLNGVSTDYRMNPDMIALIVVVVILFAALIITAIVLLIRKRLSQSEEIRNDPSASNLLNTSAIRNQETRV